MPAAGMFRAVEISTFLLLLWPRFAACGSILSAVTYGGKRSGCDPILWFRASCAPALKLWWNRFPVVPGFYYCGAVPARL